MCLKPEPRLGDEVACAFNENIFGRCADPWLPREIEKLAPAVESASSKASGRRGVFD
jgi:hypothetical protein